MFIGFHRGAGYRMSHTLQHSRPLDAAAEETARDAALTRLAVRMAVGGFALMFVAGAIMWVGFGPAMFVDLATAVVNCF
jgi:hypothetical protein